MTNPESIESRKDGEAPKANSDIDRVIDEALHHVENGYVLNRVLSGVSWGEAFGVGGRFSRFNWRANSKGIRWTSPCSGELLITPATILKRARQYESRETQCELEGLTNG
jgi:hypothetical protein